MTGSHVPLSIDTDDGEVVVSVFNIDTYDSARIRLDPDEAEGRARDLLDAARGLRDGDDATATEDVERTDDARSRQIGVPRGGPSTTPFVSRA